MKRLELWLALVLGLIIVQVVLTRPDDKLYIVQCDVGQGDATLIYKGSKQVLIDAGRPDGKVLTCLSRYMPFWDRKIELVVATHPDADHIGGLADILDRYEVELLLAPDLVHSTKQFWRTYELVRENDITVLTARKGQVLQLGEMHWTVLWPEGEYGEPLVWEYEFEIDTTRGVGVDYDEFLRRQPRDLNAASIVMSLEYGLLRALFAGEINVAEEKILLGRGVFGPVDVLKVGHHGSRTSTSVELLEAIRPRLGLIGVGENNRYGHPHREVMERLVEYEVNVGRTDIHGDLVVWSDGKRVGWEW